MNDTESSVGSPWIQTHYRIMKPKNKSDFVFVFCFGELFYSWLFKINKQILNVCAISYSQEELKKEKTEEEDKKERENRALSCPKKS